MTAFVESCVETVADSAEAAERASRGRPKVARLLQLLAGKKNILVTTHQHPDPDALASAVALCALLRAKLSPGADGSAGSSATGAGTPRINVMVKGRVGGGLNEVFVRQAEVNLKILPWDESALASFDAVILLDTQPLFAFSPLPPDVAPLAVVDHHRGRGRKPNCPFCDIRPDVGATSSIIFSYFMELEVPIPPDLGAMLLYAIESDLAGAAGTPGELDNLALSSLTLVADPRKLYQMRHADMPRAYFACYASALNNATFADSAVMSHAGEIDSLEQPAVMADFLLRLDQAQWALVTAVHVADGGTEGASGPAATSPTAKLVMSLRTKSTRQSAADVVRKLLNKLGEGGGHRTKAGGFVKLQTGSAAELDRLRRVLWRRFLKALGLAPARGQRLVPKATSNGQG